MSKFQKAQSNVNIWSIRALYAHTEMQRKMLYSDFILQGALAGLLGSIVITFWIAIGGIRYPMYRPMLPMRTDGCDDPGMSNMTSWSNMSMYTTEVMTTMSSTMSPWSDAVSQAHETVTPEYGFVE